MGNGTSHKPILKIRSCIFVGSDRNLMQCIGVYLYTGFSIKKNKNKLMTIKNSIIEKTNKGIITVSYVKDNSSFGEYSLSKLNAAGCNTNKWYKKYTQHT